MLRHGVSVSGDVRIDDRTTLQLGAGGTPGGVLAIDGGSRHTIGPGWMTFGGVGFRILDGRGAAPFLLMSASLALSSARTTDEADPLGAAFLTATDLRAGLTVGKTFFSALSPYASLRAFSGPVFWKVRGASVVGSDRFHYQPALGALLSVGAFDAFFEGAFLGERALGGGLGAAF
ncbi:MAG: hypothetical protein JWM74_5223 [Myxococcaceae bacterium]|jgi:hypothetical protein|nr:hypothetical protein [Myxococcaceae bacterium]